MKIDDFVQLGKMLGLILRHQPEIIGIHLDNQGWVEVDTLLQKMAEAGQKIDLKTLEEIVMENGSKQFSFSENGLKIRANSEYEEDESDYVPKFPPKILYHPTSASEEREVLKTGIEKGKRHFVHLCGDLGKALEVGKKFNRPLVLGILSGRMFKEGYQFYHSGTGEWLTEYVPPHFLRPII